MFRCSLCSIAYVVNVYKHVVIAFCCYYQGCQMVYLYTKNPTLGIFWRALKIKCWYFSWPFGIFYRNLVHLLYFAIIWYIVARFGTLYQWKIWQPWLLLAFNHFSCHKKPDLVTFNMCSLILSCLSTCKLWSCATWPKKSFVSKVSNQVLLLWSSVVDLRA
jgi:hypothetical protein